MYHSKDKNPVATLGDFIWTMEDSLDGDFCDHLIDRFNKDHRRYNGQVGQGRYDPDVKQTKDLCVSKLDDWKEEDEKLYNSLNNGLQQYYNHIRYITSGYTSLEGFSDVYDFRDKGYQIQRYEPNGFYDWHVDYQFEEEYGARVITFIWYLNTLKNEGYTQFIDGTKVQPKKGTLVCFPATWNYLHRAYPSPDEVKYICTGWCYTRSKNE